MNQLMSTVQVEVACPKSEYRAFQPFFPFLGEHHLVLYTTCLHCDFDLPNGKCPIGSQTPFLGANMAVENTFVLFFTT